MKNYTRIEHGDTMFSFNHDGFDLKQDVIKKLTEFILEMPVEVSTAIEFNIRTHFEDLKRSAEEKRNQKVHEQDNDDDLPF